MFHLLAKKVFYEGGDFSYEFTVWGYLAIALLIVLFVLGAAFITGSNKHKKISVRQMAFCSIAVALATVASLIKLPLPFLVYGGSVTLLSMFFVCLVGYWYGLKTGIMTAVAYAFLQLILEPFVISIPQLLFDYVLAFGALGLSGFFSKSKHGLIKGYILGIFGRFLFSFISGILFFSQYAASYNTIPVIYSAVYNGSYVGIEGAVTLLIIALPPVTGALIRVKRMAVEDISSGSVK